MNESNIHKYISWTNRQIVFELSMIGFVATDKVCSNKQFNPFLITKFNSYVQNTENTNTYNRQNKKKKQLDI